jgi:hypothetical protein
MNQIGSIAYLRYSLLLVVLTNVLMLFMQYIIRRWRGPPQVPSYTAGYSGVIFGWFAISCFVAPMNGNLFGLSLSPFIMLFVYLGISQLILPNVSFTGHLSGIIIGLLIGGGAFHWFNDYLAICLLIWVLIGMIVSLKISHRFEMNYIRILDADEVNGPRMEHGSEHSDTHMREERHGFIDLPFALYLQWWLMRRLLCVCVCVCVNPSTARQFMSLFPLFL